jgi:hypothetical protein
MEKLIVLLPQSTLDIYSQHFWRIIDVIFSPANRKIRLLMMQMGLDMYLSNSWCGDYMVLAICMNSLGSRMGNMVITVDTFLKFDNFISFE